MNKGKINEGKRRQMEGRKRGKNGGERKKEQGSGGYAYHTKYIHKIYYMNKYILKIQHEEVRRSQGATFA